MNEEAKDFLVKTKNVFFFIKYSFDTNKSANKYLICG